MHEQISLEGWLAKLEVCHPKTIDLTLDRITTVAQRLDLKPTGFVITVGGTNGKGSCTALLESILQQAGFSTGAYFSPHLLVFNERIRLNGVEVTDEALLKAFTAIEQARGKITLTYFEFVTLAAFWLFQRANLEYWILEVGLGGRYDAVNIIDANLAIIASISLDHTDLLGNTRELIGREKAGIFRKKQCVVYGENDIPVSVQAESDKLECDISCQGKEFNFNKNAQSWDFIGKRTFKNLPYPAIALQNAATVLQAISLLPHDIPEHAIISGLRNINLKGRFQRVSSSLIVDVAHNPASAQQLAENIKTLKKPRQLHALVGMLRDKDHYNILSLLAEQFDTWWVTGLAGERGATSKIIGDCLKHMTSKPIFLFSAPEMAYDELMKQLHPEDCVIVFGSFLTVGAVLKHHSKVKVDCHVNS